MRLQILLFASFFLLSCGSEQKKEPQAVSDREITLSPEVRERLANLRQQTDTRDSLLNQLINLPENEKALVYQQSLSGIDSVTDLLTSGRFRDWSRMAVTGKTASGYRKIYFRRLTGLLADSAMSYPTGTVFLAENLDPSTKKTINFEGMVKTESGWEFLVFNSRMKSDTSGRFYSYPNDCISCHFSPVNQNPMARFGQYLNSPDPISGSGISYDGFVSARLLPDLMTHDKIDGVFGPYLKLSRSRNTP